MKTKITPVSKSYYFLILIILASNFCSSNLYSQSYDCFSSVEPEELENNVCDFDIADAPDLPIVTIKINIYFKENQHNENFINLDYSDLAPWNGTRFATDFITRLNYIYQNFELGSLGNGSFIGDSRLRFELNITDDPDNINGVYYVGNEFTNKFVYNNVVNILIQDDESNNPNYSIWGETGSNIYLYNALTYPNETTIYGGLTAHEFGHFFGLCHSWYPGNVCASVDLNVADECNGSPTNATCGGGKDGCDLCNSGSNNLMNYCNSHLGLTPCQWRIVYSHAVYSQSPSISKECDESGDPIEISSGNIVWDNAKIVTNKVIISPGASLTINCAVRFTSNAIIEVQRGAKLFVNEDAVLTNLCSGHRWQGIEVWGNSDKPQPDPYGTLTSDDAGVVFLRRCIIKNANAGVSTLASSISWPDYTDYFGGIIDAENCFFTNCRKGVAFMKYDIPGGEPNKSRFYNCEFKRINSEFIDISGSDNLARGVTIWQCRGIDFQRNSFIDLDKEGVYGIDFSANFTNGNYFSGLKDGISILSTSPGASNVNILGTKIGSNEFQNSFIENERHIFAAGNSFFNGLTIKNNFFQYGTKGIDIDNDVLFDISFNHFDTHEIAIDVLNTGIRPNYIKCNDIIQSCIGINALNKNKRTRFTGNTFVTNKYDFNMDAGTINPYQGDPGLPADNCFSSGAGHLHDMRVPSISSNFKYWVDDAIPTSDCKYPENLFNANYYSINPTTKDVGALACPTDTYGIIADTTVYTLNDFTTSKSATASALSNYTIHPGSTTERTYYNSDKETYYIFGKLLDQSLTSRNITLADTLLQLEGTTENTRLRFGLYMREQNYVKAQTILNSLPLSSAEDTTFKIVQQININRMLDTMGYRISPSDSLTLEGAIGRGGLNAEYASAMFGVFRNDRAPYNVPVCPDAGHIGGKINDNHKSIEKLQIAELTLYPNPTKDNLHVIFPNTEKEILQIKIFDMNGKLAYIVDHIYGDNYDVNTSTLQPGVYRLILFNEQNNYLSGKNIFIHR